MYSRCLPRGLRIVCGGNQIVPTRPDCVKRVAGKDHRLTKIVRYLLADIRKPVRSIESELAGEPSFTALNSRASLRSPRRPVLPTRGSGSCCRDTELCGQFFVPNARVGTWGSARWTGSEPAVALLKACVRSERGRHIARVGQAIAKDDHLGETAQQPARLQLLEDKAVPKAIIDLSSLLACATRGWLGPLEKKTNPTHVSASYFLL